MAYIRQYAGGWRAEVQRNGQRASKLFDTKRAAQAWAIEQESTAKAIGKGWRTFAQAREQYEQTHTAKKKSRRWECNALARLEAEFGADTPLGSIDTPRLTAWRDKRLKSVSGSTVQREANLLRNLLNVARLEWHWIGANPFEGLKLPPENDARHQVWGWKLIKRVLRAPRTGKTAEMQRAFHIALRTSLRLSEVLKAPDGFDKRRQVVVLESSKTTGRVEVPVGRIAARLIEPSRFTVGPNEGSVLFSNLLRELMIDGLTFHDSRATALTHLSRRVDVMTLAKISKHKDIRILQNVYYRESAQSIAQRLPR